ncbi:MAG: DUF4835 family protein [Flavobacteriia bacterium]|nr:DUF4835 family protein [Flavobacteriia bacterium]NBV67620.1 DUF4835 family protein [Flavobacteriia bacterium]NBV91560.1 DUF4835 family protein [Flavobacteriia bacterium]NBY39713.1 DUF4835 family protein [Flavobacteriia bacterium]
MKRLFLVVSCFLSVIGFSQELNCKVTIIKEASLEVNSTELEIFKELEQIITDMMNNTQWTKDPFKTEERINCNLQLQINKIPSPGTYGGAIQIQCTRPVFNSNYNTLLFNFRDEDLAFTFSRNTLVTYTPNQFRDNLSSILAFYAYFIIGMDYDSFSLKGGTKYFNECQQIVSNAQNSGAPGWKSSEQGKRNRFWLVDNILQQAFEPLRECSYSYHRKGMDVMFDDKVKAKKSLFEALSKLSPVVLVRPNSPNVVNYLLCKRDELKSILSDSELKEKTDFVSLLKKLDPSNSSKYQEILD